jgi:nicotinamide-nucleotide amidase
MSGLADHAARVIKAAKAAKMTLVTAESCTAGALALQLADAPGAAETFHGGFIVYTKENKTAALGVPANLIAAKSAVSRDVAEAMATGALSRCPADIAVAITGVAGPEPDEGGNPVGLVYVAGTVRGQPVAVRECNFGRRSRDQIRELTIDEALTLIEVLLDA